MITVRLYSFAILSSAILLVNSHVARADSLFNFEANASGTATQFTDTVNGLSATFGGKASVCDSFGIFQSLFGNVLVQQICGPTTESGPLSISFSANLTRIKFNFATVGGPSTVTVTAFNNSTDVGSQNFTSTVPAGYANGESLASFAGTFDRLTLTASTLLAIDNVNAITTAPVPEPTAYSIVLVGISLLAALARWRKC